jgi:hypothetical protein
MLSRELTIKMHKAISNWELGLEDLNLLNSRFMIVLFWNNYEAGHVFPLVWSLVAFVLFGVYIYIYIYQFAFDFCIGGFGFMT